MGRIALLVGLTLASCTPTSALAASFRVFSGSALGISRNGEVVAGVSANTQGFVWKEGSGLTLFGATFSPAYGASDDGLAAVGTKDRAFRWMPVTGIAFLGDLPGGGDRSAGVGISSDGSVLVGQGESSNGVEAFRWTIGTGMMGLGDLDGGDFYSIATAVSADGSVVVGTSRSHLGEEPFRWTESGGMIGLGTLGESSIARAVSGDGSWVAGKGRITFGVEEAFLWSEATGLEPLGDLEGGLHFSDAYGVSGDGSIVVGESDADGGRIAFLWTRDAGMRSLRDVLIDEYGLDELSGWTLESAYAISDDGNRIVGSGRNPQGGQVGWLVTLHPIPEPSSLSLLLAGLALLPVGRRRQS